MKSLGELNNIQLLYEIKQMHYSLQMTSLMMQELTVWLILLKRYGRKVLRN